jgi:hypothetical protein
MGRYTMNKEDIIAAIGYFILILALAIVLLNAR